MILRRFRSGLRPAYPTRSASFCYHRRVKRFVLPAVLFALIVSVAPAIGEVRDFLFKTLSEGPFIRWLGGAFAVVALLCLAVAVCRIHTDGAGHRKLRYAGLGGVGLLLWIQTAGLGAELARVNVVEKVHVLEYGLLGWLLYRAIVPRREDGVNDPALLVVVFAVVAVAGTLEEGVQWLVPRRIGDIRDVGINALSGLVGLLFGLVLEPPRRWSWWPAAARVRSASRAAAVALLAAGLFFGLAHLGYEISDPEIGRFRSRWTAEELLAISAERRREWALKAPKDLATWGVEDYFLTEAGWQLSHRNDAFRDGWYAAAWPANRILEKYYAPVLDLEGYRQKGRRRFPPQVRAKLMAHKGGYNPATYVSPVGLGRLYPVPKVPYYALLAAVVLLLWSVPPRWAASREPSKGG